MTALYNQRNRFALLLAILLMAGLQIWQSARYGSGQDAVKKAEARMVEQDRRIDARLGELLQTADSASTKSFLPAASDRSSGTVYFMYRNNRMVRWSDHEPDLPYLLSDTLKDRSLVTLPNGVFWLRIQRSGEWAAVGLFLVRHQYAYENRYLRNEFNPVLGLSAGLRSGEGPLLHAPDGTVVSMLSADGFTVDADDPLVSALWWLAILLFLTASVQLGLHQHRYRLPIACGILLLRAWTAHAALPTYLYATELFSPSLYASTWFADSLGDLLLNVCASLAAVSLLPLQLRIGRTWALAAVAVSAAGLLSMDYRLLQGLVMDSRISFNSDELSSIDRNTVLALLAVAVLYLTESVLLLRLFAAAGIRWNVRSAVGILVVVSLFTGVTLHGFTRQKELEERMRVAQRVGMQRDPVAEYLLGSELRKISRDADIALLAKEGKPSSDAVEAMIASRYLRSYLSRFELSVEVPDTVNGFFEWASQQGTATEQSYLYSLAPRLGRMEYAAFLPLLTPQEDTVGVLAVSLRPRVFTSAQGFPELFISGMPRERELPESYSYAIYTGDALSLEYGRFPYPVNGRTFSVVGDGAYDRSFSEGYDHLALREGDKTIVVSRPAASAFSLVTLFSWVFTFFGLFLYACHAIVRRVRRVPVQASLTRRIRIAVFVLVILSFVGIGAGTVRYIFTKYEDDQRRTISEHLNGLWIELDEILRQEADFKIPVVPDLQQRLQMISKNTNIDYNVFDGNGRLVFSSQPRIYEQGIVSDRMNPSAFSHLQETRQTQFLDREQVGKLSYIAAYAPFLSSRGEMMGFLQLPYFEKQKERSREISGFLSALLNSYVLLFALAVFLTAFISSRITQPLSLIQERMAGVRLGRKNEPIRYETKDEIGQLVDEYNRMLKELSDSADRLAQGEREGAWREMARQVAHEIKNPLTPMKLSVQHLQRAWKEHRDDREAMTEKMAQTLIQQIDTLSAIATEFSNFAQMPKAEPVIVDIQQILDQSIDLFRKSSEHEFRYDGTEGAVFVKADPAQLNRVFSNLLKNAVQAIPPERQGHIEVGLKSLDGYAVVTVQDDGIGITEEQRSSIFVPNFTTKSGGTGLGLAMVKNIVEQAGGNVGFESTPGAGTLFTIRFPLTDESA